MSTRLLFLAACTGGVILFACQSDTPKQAATPPPALNELQAAPKPELMLYAALVDNLRMRETPSQSGAVLAQFKEGAILEGTGEASGNQEEIELRGIPIAAPYYRVQPPGGGSNPGWVFGGALACLYAGPRNGCPEPGRLGEIGSFLAALNVKDINSGGKAWAYIEKNLGDAPVSLADAAFIMLDHTLRRMEQEGEFYQLTEKINWSDTDMQAVYEGTFDVNKNPVTKSLAANGFRLFSSEGMVFPVVDQRKLLAFFGPKVSTAMRAFLEQRTAEQNEPMYDDGGVIVPLEKLADMAVFWEKFNRDNPYFPLRDETAESERWLRLLIVNGADNTPLFDYETDAITEDFKNVWVYVQQKYPETKLAKLSKQMADLCAAEGWKHTKKVEDFQASLNAANVTGE